jgi:SAM-dependent methyltransferase
LRTATPELVTGLATKAEYDSFMADNPSLRSSDLIESIVEHAVQEGVLSAFLGQIPPEQVAVCGKNFREDLVAAGLNPRHRAVLELIALEPWYSRPNEARIYAAEALTPFAMTMRGRFPRFIGSEFAETFEARADLFPICFQDLTALTWPNHSFDCVITNDCLEHVPDIDGCLRELCRVLRKGGVALCTFPFSYGETGVVRARAVGDEILYLTEPEYHGNPAAPNEGSLVFEIPGWDIVDRTRSSGFAKSEMAFVSSLERGITATEIAGILVLRCYK